MLNCSTKATYYKLNYCCHQGRAWWSPGHLHARGTGLPVAFFLFEKPTSCWSWAAFAAPHRASEQRRALVPCTPADGPSRDARPRRAQCTWAQLSGTDLSQFDPLRPSVTREVKHIEIQIGISFYKHT